MGFAVGTSMTVDNALKMLLVHSANDIAVALSETVGGSEARFVGQMNGTARSLGMSSTHYDNPNGLPSPGQLTTARDLAVLARALLQQYPEYRDYFRIPAIKAGRRILRSQKALLKRYPGTTGMKTGFICDSGFNTVVTATREGRTLIVVVLGATTPVARAELAAKLLNVGFMNGSFGFPRVQLASFRAGPSPGPAVNLHDAVCGRHRRKPAEAELELGDVGAALGPPIATMPPASSIRGRPIPARSSPEPTQAWRRRRRDANSAEEDEDDAAAARPSAACRRAGRGGAAGEIDRRQGGREDAAITREAPVTTAAHGRKPPIPLTLLDGVPRRRQDDAPQPAGERPRLCQDGGDHQRVRRRRDRRLLVERAEEGIIELSSGCVCCTIRGELVEALERLLRAVDNRRVDEIRRVVIEKTGLADPAPILYLLTRHPYLSLRFRLDGIVTVVDAVNAMANLDAHDEAVRQVAVADRIVLAKSGERGAAAAAVTARIRRLNPGAAILDAERGEATATALTGCGAFDPDAKGADVRRWLAAEAFEDHHHEGHAGDHEHHHHHDDDHDHDHTTTTMTSTVTMTTSPPSR